ncbi:MAG: NADPH-dependent FMN reductase [Acidobacteriota bacterium]|nr:NADPH-dependent FMN reductase [Acidobacteriota bacterium]
MNDQAHIRIVVIRGSVRPGAYTTKACKLVLDELSKLDDVAVTEIDPRPLELPLPGLDPDHAGAAGMREIVSSATGVIFATPEYHGGISGVTKLVIDNLGFPSVLAGKPIALLGVAAGQIGAIKALEQLRSVLSHVGAIVLPGPVSVAGVRKVFDENDKPVDEAMEKRIRGVAVNLVDYIKQSICPRIALENMVREGDGT